MTEFPLSFYESLGLVGAMLYIVAYALLQYRRNFARTYAYTIINLVATLFLLTSLSEKWNIAAFVGNVFWFLISLYGLHRCYKYTRKHRARGTRSVDLIQASAVIFTKGGKVLIAQRPKHKKIMPDYWEFPGGKLEEDETPEGCAIRECEEELGVKPQSLRSLTFISHSRDYGHVVVYLYLCDEWEGEPVGKEGQAIQWLTPDELENVDLLPANIPIIPLVRDSI